MDTRFSYCALCALWLLDRLDAINVPAAAAYVAACKNFDGGFGCTPGGRGVGLVPGIFFVSVIASALLAAAGCGLLHLGGPAWLLGFGRVEHGRHPSMH